MYFKLKKQQLEDLTLLECGYEIDEKKKYKE